MSTLIGRDHPASVLHARLERTATSHGGLVLVGGEPGIGKTTLVTHALAHAAELGLLVVTGTCWDSPSAPELWPWTQLRRGLERSLGPARWMELGVGATLTSIDTGEFEVFDAVGSLLTEICRDQPLVLVLDDLQWADPASVRLLEFLSRHGWYERLLLIATYRDVEVQRADHPLREPLSVLLSAATVLRLSGLDADGVADLVQETTGSRPDPAAAEDLRRLTGGNPFFVQQSARLFEEGATGPTTGVLDAVRRRLAPLPPEVVRVLTTAALLGREIDPDLVQRTTAAPVGPALAQAAAAGLVTRTAFVHDLVRECLVQDLTDPAPVHARIVAAGADRLLPGELAGHAVAAGTLIEPDVTVDLLVTAARDASGRWATDESIGYLRQALARATAPARRAMIGRDLVGELLFHRTDHLAEAAVIFEQTLADARLAGPAVLAQVVIALAPNRILPADRLDEVIAEAHRALIGPTTADAAGRHGALVERLAELARADGDDRTLAETLSARHHTIWGPGSAGERITLLREIDVVSRRGGHRDDEQFAAALLWVALLEQGDPAFLEQFRLFVALAERYRSPQFAMGALTDRHLVELFLGRLDEAERLLREVAADDSLESDTGYTWMLPTLQFNLHLRRGRFQEAARTLAGFDRSDPTQDRELAAAVLAAESGDLGASADYCRTRGDDLPAPVVRAQWHRVLALSAHGTGDPELLQRCRSQLGPLLGTWSVGLYGCDLGGPLTYYLGLAEAGAGDRDRAVELLDRALQETQLLSSRLWWSEAAVARLSVGDAPADLRPRALATAEELGQHHLIRRLHDLPAEAPVSVGIARGRLSRDGRVWTAEFDGFTALLPDAKGLRDLSTLLQRPGVDVPAADLIDPEATAATALGADPVVDEQALRAYRSRLEHLDDEIDDTSLSGDEVGQQRLEREREALLAQLRSAAGLGGRVRRLGDETERARKTVTARIRDTFRKLDTDHPALAAHLRASVFTGTTCVYRPPLPVEWDLRTGA